ncbi:MAG: hypothetical protein KAI84_21585, partial [Gammaproteobacteria bacterium]|nr:hypothetical protein [Gammaproteobacteria bacterium]
MQTRAEPSVSPVSQSWGIFTVGEFNKINSKFKSSVVKSMPLNLAFAIEWYKIILDNRSIFSIIFRLEVKKCI